MFLTLSFFLLFLSPRRCVVPLAPPLRRGLESGAGGVPRPHAALHCDPRAGSFLIPGRWGGVDGSRPRPLPPSLGRGHAPPPSRGGVRTRPAERAYCLQTEGRGGGWMDPAGTLLLGGGGSPSHPRFGGSQPYPPPPGRGGGLQRSLPANSSPTSPSALMLTGRPLWHTSFCVVWVRVHARYHPIRSLYVQKNKLNVE